MSGIVVSRYYCFIVYFIILILILPNYNLFNKAENATLKSPENTEIEDLDQVDIPSTDTVIGDRQINQDSDIRSSRQSIRSSDEVWLQKGLPSARSEHAVAFDEVNKKMYMYGGWDLSNELSDLWCYDAESDEWEDLNDGLNPGGRHDHRIVFVSSDNNIYLFGGYDGSDMKNDLWVYNTQKESWYLLNDGTLFSPSPRRGFGMVYDSGQNSIFIFGGTDGLNYYNDIWKLDFSTRKWTEITITGLKPDKRANLDMVYDSSNNIIYMFGGFDGTNYLDDLWKFEAGISAWSSINPLSTNNPPDRSYHSMVFEPNLGRIYMFGGIYLTISDVKEYRGDFWYYDITANRWSQPEDGAAPNPRAKHAMTVDTITGYIYILEGYSGEFREDLWRYNIQDDSWDIIYDSSPVINPSIRNGQGLIFDFIGNNLYYFGGYYYDGQPHYREDMWEFNLADGKWTMVNEGTGPEARFARGVVYDEHHHEIYMFGGYFYDFYGQTRNYLNDLWLYNITTHSWIEIDDGTTVPSPRDGHTMIYDPINQEIYLHGGRKWITGTTYEYYGDLWKYNTGTKIWTDLTDATTVTPRSRQEMCYDSRHGDIYVFGGYNATGYNNELWKYNIATDNWSIITQNGDIPSIRGAHDLVYDGLNDDIYLFSGKDRDTPTPRILNDFFKFNVSTETWTELNLPVGRSPNPRIQYGFVYDHLDTCIYLSGGYTYDTADRFYADLWRYDIPSGNWTELKVKRPYPAPAVDSKLTFTPSTSNGELYLFGGYDGENYLDRLWKYELNTNQITQVDEQSAERPSGRRAHGMVVMKSVVNDYVCLFGGTNGTLLDDLWIYQIQNNLVGWEKVSPTGPDKPSARERFPMVYETSSSAAYLFGGWNGTSLGDFWKLKYESDFFWTKITPTNSGPSARYRHELAADSQNGIIYLFGGFDAGLKYKNDLWKYDIGANTWTEITGYIGTPPSPRDSASLHYDSETNCIFVFGGKDTNNFYNDYFKFDIDNNVWISVNTTNAVPSPRHSFAYTYGEAKDMIFSYGGWSGYYKGDLWSWKVADPGITGINISLEDEYYPGMFRTIQLVHSRFMDYDFKVKVRDATSYKNLESVVLNLDNYGENIKVKWTEQTGLFEETNDPNDHIELSADSYAEHDGIQNWTIHFLIKFNWTYPNEVLQGVEISAYNDDPLSKIKEFYNVYRVENDLDLKGTLDVEGEEQGPLTERDWVKKAEKITWGNLSVGYGDGSTLIGSYSGKLPIDEFDVAVFDDDGRSWIQDLGEYEKINIDTEASNVTDVTEDYSINIIGIPQQNDISDVTFSLKVDATPVTFSDPSPSESELNNALKVKCSINISDPQNPEGSGVDTATIEYSISTNGGITWGDWQNAGLTGIKNSLVAEVEPTFEDGFRNYIRWRATDAVGNELILSEPHKILIDLSYSPSAPTAELISPSDNSEVSDLRPIFIWKADDPEGDPIKYEIYYGLDETKVRDRDASLRKAGSLDLPLHKAREDLRDGFTYYWTVIPYDENYTGRCLSGVWNFTVKTETPVVPTTNLSLPENGAIINSRTPELQWYIDASGLTYVNNLIVIYPKEDESTGSLPNGTALFTELKSTTESTGTFTVPQTALLDKTEYEWLVIPIEGKNVGVCLNGPWSFTINLAYKEIYNLSLQLPSEYPIKVGTNASIPISVKNSGNVIDIINIDVQSTQLKDHLVLESSEVDFSLESNQERKLRLNITIPLDFKSGDYSVEITATSLGSGGDHSISEIIMIKVQAEDTKKDGKDEEGLNTLVIAGIIIAIIIILIVVFFFFMNKKKKEEEKKAAAVQVAPAPGEVTAEVSYIPKDAFASEQAAISAVAGEAGAAPGAALPEVAAGAPPPGAAVTPTEALPPQTPQYPTEPTETTPVMPVSPYEGARTEAPAEPPTPEGWEAAPQLPPGEQVTEQPAEEDVVRFDTLEGEAPPVPEPAEPQPEQPEQPESQYPPQQPTEEEQQYYQYQQQQVQQQQYPQQQVQQAVYIPCSYCGAQNPWGYTNCFNCGGQLFYQ